MAPGFHRFKVNGEEVDFTLLQCVVLFPELHGSDVVGEAWNAGVVLGRFDEKGDLDLYGNPALPREWGNSPTPESLNDLDIEIRGKHVSRKLRRGITYRQDPYLQQPREFVYLRDVVEALGGKYRYDKPTNTVLINFPTKAKRPIKPG